MVQTSNKSSRKTDVETRDRQIEYSLKVLQHPIYKAKFWCSERKDFFNYMDWLYK